MQTTVVTSLLASNSNFYQKYSSRRFAPRCRSPHITNNPSNPLLTQPSNEAQNAINMLNGVEINGRPIQVNQAQPKNGGGGGFGGRGGYNGGYNGGGEGWFQ